MFFLLCFQGRTALHNAAGNPNFKSDHFPILLENGSKPDEVDKEVDTLVVTQEFNVSKHKKRTMMFGTI